ncbi:NAD(P)/FAD-dependent oxidoreductase [uncultured Enterovirga sp.]|uniref:NAD(P)/FAD-dependent oxidoreductase n=1 Tax=uncultured Enterovirga sp. TaxID=2026352 RepID=UPI0035CA06EE
MIEVDVAVVGGGIAGASAAAHLAAERSVVLLEREDQPGYHASGRSAALFSETYGNAVVRALSVASRPFLERPPEGFATHPLLAPRGALHVGAKRHEAQLATLLRDAQALVPSVRALSGEEARSLVPLLRPDVATTAVFEPDAQDIDTHALLSGFLRIVRARGGQVVTRAEVTALAHDGVRWRIESRAGPVSAAIVIDAAGAWADGIAGLAGLAPLGLRPKRRTAFVFEPPAGLDVAAWPMVIGADEEVYVKPEAGLLLASPADETDSEPTDAQPEEIDVATAAERVEALLDLPVRRIVRRWAGLRTFAPDRTPVVGFDPRQAGFFWLAGQGGYGFQTAPALGRAAGELILGGTLPADLTAAGIRAADLAPERFLR